MFNSIYQTSAYYAGIMPALCQHNAAAYYTQNDTGMIGTSLVRYS